METIENSITDFFRIKIFHKKEGKFFLKSLYNRVYFEEIKPIKRYSRKAMMLGIDI